MATGLPATLARVAGYHTSTGAPSVGSVKVVSPTPNGPGRVKLVGPRCATVGTVSPRTVSVPGTETAGAAADPASTTIVEATMATRATFLAARTSGKCMTPTLRADDNGTPTRRRALDRVVTFSR